ncbi:hypothetical protein V3G39_09460 [Dermatophilaceae bacterium Sec6.4]
MRIATPLAADLALLSAALYDPASDSTTDVAQTVLGFAANARSAVQSFVGLTATITAAEHAAEEERTCSTPGQVVLRLTLLDEHADPGSITTSLLLSGLPGGADAGEPIIQFVLYAGVPGAFVDLAADIAFLTGQELDPADLDQHLSLAGEPDVTGVLQADRTIGEAVGVLIDRGHTHDQAYAELDALAMAANTNRTTEASQILVTLTGGDGGTS